MSEELRREALLLRAQALQRQARERMQRDATASPHPGRAERARDGLGPVSGGNGQQPAQTHVSAPDTERNARVTDRTTPKRHGISAKQSIGHPRSAPGTGRNRTCRRHKCQLVSRRTNRRWGRVSCRSLRNPGGPARWRRWRKLVRLFGPHEPEIHERAARYPSGTGSW